VPLKLKTPENSIGRPVFRCRISILDRLQGSQASHTQNLEAVTLVILICGTLYAGFWIQFVTGILYNLPALYTLSGGKWPYPDLNFYLKPPGSYPFSVAGNFLFYSSFGSALALLFGWFFTRVAAGKWRLRFAVLVFVTILMGWSGAAYMGVRAAWNEGLEAEIVTTKNDWRRASRRNEDEWLLKYYRLRLEELEALAGNNPYRKD